MFTILKNFISPFIPTNLTLYIILGLVISNGLTYELWQHEKTRSTAIASEYTAFKVEQARIVAEYRADIAKKETSYNESLKTLEENYIKDLNDLKINRDQLRKELQNAANNHHSLLNDVSVWQNRANSSGMPKDAQNTSISTEAERDCNSTIASLTKAGASCAIDYANIYKAWDNICNIYGCQ